MNRTEHFRIDEYDIAKGVGILLVVIGHGLPTDNFWRTFIYSFHMPLFFFLSGFVLKNPKGKISLASLCLYDKRLIVNYIFWSVMYLLYDVIACVAGIEKLGLSSLILRVYQSVTLFGISVLWFLPTLVLGKWLVLFICNKAKAVRFCVFIGCVLFLAGSLLALLLPDGLSISGIVRIIYYPISMIVRTLILASFIMFGYVLKDHIKIIFEKSKIFVGAIALISFTFVYFFCRYSQGIDFHFSKVGLFPITFLTSISGLVLVLSCSSLVAKINILKSIFIFFGKNSLFIMATHEYFGIKLMITNMLEYIKIEFNGYFLTYFNIVLLLLFEIVLVFCVKPWIDKLLNLIIGWFDWFFCSAKNVD